MGWFNDFINFEQYFDKEVTAENLDVTYLRAHIAVGGPLRNGNERYANKNDRIQE